MNLDGVAPGTRLVTTSGDIAELIEVAANGEARVRYVEVLGGAEAVVGSEASISNDDIATFDGDRFTGPPRTSSSGA
jgi:hypothetical protein